MKIRSQKILVSKLRALGDTVLMTATLSELRRLLPESEIHILIPEAYQELLKNHPSVDRIWPVQSPRSMLERWFFDLQLLKKIRVENFDVFLGLHAGPRAAFFARWGGFTQKFLHNHNFAEKDFCSDRPIEGREKLAPFTHRDLKVLKTWGLEVSFWAQPSLFVDSAKKNDLLESLPKGPRLGLGLGASRATKIWPMEFFAEAARDWKKRFPSGTLFLFVSAFEKALAESFEKFYLEKGGKSSDFVCQDSLNLSELMLHISVMDLFLGNDSGPRHMAAALGIPTFTLYGPQDPFECHPYDIQQHPFYFYEGLDCRTHADPSGHYRWCGLKVCVEKKHECMKKIPPGLVAKDLIEKTFELGRVI